MFECSEALPETGFVAWRTEWLPCFWYDLSSGYNFLTMIPNFQALVFDFVCRHQQTFPRVRDSSSSGPPDIQHWYIAILEHAISLPSPRGPREISVLQASRIRFHMAILCWFGVTESAAELRLSHITRDILTFHFSCLSSSARQNIFWLLNTPHARMRHYDIMMLSMASLEERWCRWTFLKERVSKI